MTLRSLKGTIKTSLSELTRSLRASIWDNAEATASLRDNPINLSLFHDLENVKIQALAQALVELGDTANEFIAFDKADAITNVGSVYTVNRQFYIVGAGHVFRVNTGSDTEADTIRLEISATEYAMFQTVDIADGTTVASFEGTSTGDGVVNVANIRWLGEQFRIDAENGTIKLNAVVRVGAVDYSYSSAEDATINSEVQLEGGNIFGQETGGIRKLWLSGGMVYDGSEAAWNFLSATSQKAAALTLSENGIEMYNTTNAGTDGQNASTGSPLSFFNDGSSNWKIKAVDNHMQVYKKDSASIPNTTTTTFFTVDDNEQAEGIYAVQVKFQDNTTAGSAGLYFARSGDRTLVQLSKNSSGSIDLTHSGRNIQVYQASGSTKTVEWSITKLNSLE